MVKKLLLASMGIAGACAACCAVPLLLPAIAGLSAAGLAGLGDGLLRGWTATTALWMAAAGMGVAALAVWFARQRQRAAAPGTARQRGGTDSTPAAGPACGCSATRSGPTLRVNQTTEPRHLAHRRLRCSAGTSHSSCTVA